MARITDSPNQGNKTARNMALARCWIKWPTPDLAEPRPRARDKGVRSEFVMRVAPYTKNASAKMMTAPTPPQIIVAQPDAVEVLGEKPLPASHTKWRMPFAK